MGDFSDDVNGMFAGIGDVSPARELGLAPQSVSLSAATGKQYASPRYQQAELGVEADRAEKVPGPRTTSLPTNLQVEINASEAERKREREASEHDTVRPTEVPVLGSPLAPSVRLVQTPRLNSDPDRLAVTSDDIAKSYYAPGENEAGDESSEERGRRMACDFLEGNFKQVPEDKVAEFLGGPREVNAIALKYYMQYFGMKGNLVDCFRYVHS